MSERMVYTPGVDRLPRMGVGMLERTVALNKFVPHNPWPKQIAFLELECLDALFGGAASGGKSDALLMLALQFVEVPGYAALIVRRRFKDLELPGGLIDRSLEWLAPHVKSGAAHWNGQEHRWRFRGGATIQFGYADKDGDERRYDGSEFSTICLDEAVQLTERQIVYFFERLRRKASIPVPLRMRLGTTPGGASHDFLKARYVSPGTEGKGYVAAAVDDNPALDAAQYRLSLEEIRRSNPLRYRQMLLGDWDAVAGGRFKPEWLEHVWVRDAVSPDFCVLFRADPGGVRTEVERFNWRTAATFMTYDPSASASNQADHFVASTWKLTPGSNVVWWGCHRDRMNIPDQVRVVRRVYKEHRPQFIAVEKVLNQTAPADYLRESTDPVVVVKPVSPGGKDKLERAQGAIILAESGRLFLPESHPTFPLEDVRGELVRFTGLTDDEDSDITDTLSYAVQCLHFVRPGGPGRGGSAPFVWTGRAAKDPYFGLGRR